jgi:hypothetical protein
MGRGGNAGRLDGGVLSQHPAAAIVSTAARTRLSAILGMYRLTLNSRQRHD